MVGNETPLEEDGLVSGGKQQAHEQEWRDCWDNAESESQSGRYGCGCSLGATSLEPKSLHFREITGNFLKYGFWGPHIEANIAASSMSYPLFPAKIIREYFRR